MLALIPAAGLPVSSVTSKMGSMRYLILIGPLRSRLPSIRRSTLQPYHIHRPNAFAVKLVSLSPSPRPTAPALALPLLLGALAGLAGCLNIYTFMDGIDGISNPEPSRRLIHSRGSD